MKPLYLSILLGLPLCPLVLTSCSDKKEEATEELETSGYQSTPADFLRAAENGDIRALGLFLKQEIDLHTKDDNGWTALHLAARAKKQESIAFLLDAGMDVDTLGLDGITPLMLAAREGNTSIVRYLLSQGAKGELKDEKNRTALVLAVEGGHKSAVEELAPYSRSQLDTALLYAAAKGKHQVIDTLTSFGASVYVRHDGGMTPLMLAAHHGHTDTVNSLLESGANRYAVNEHGWTAAQVAEAAGRENMEALLNQVPTEGELSLTEPENTDSVDWEVPAEIIAANEVAVESSPEATSADVPVDAVASRSDTPVVNTPAPKVTKTLPFISGKTIASKSETPTAVAADIAMVDYQEKPLPLIVEKTSAPTAGEGSKAELRMLYGKHQRIEVSEGSVIPETQFKIVNIRRKLNHSKITDGQPTDVSVVEIEDTRTGRRRELRASIPATAVEPWAVMRAQSSGEYYAVRAGQSFATADGQNFTVTDVRPNQLVITHHGSGEVSTIPLGR